MYMNTKSKKLKSWHIALVGSSLNFIIGFLFYKEVITIPVNDIGSGILSIFLSFYYTAMMIFSFIGLIPTLLLYFKPTRMFGILLAMLLGILGIVLKVGLIMSIFFIFAIAWYFVKEKE